MKTAVIYRTTTILERRFSTVARVGQKYLVAKILFEANIPNDASFEKSEKKKILELYCNSKKVINRNGGWKPSSPVKFVDAILFLGRVSNFSMNAGGLPPVDFGREISPT